MLLHFEAGSPATSALAACYSLGMAMLSSESVNEQIDELLLSGRALTVSEAEEMFLDSHLSEIARLVELLDDEEFERHEAVKLLMSHGSRRLEDALRRRRSFAIRYRSQAGLSSNARHGRSHCQTPRESQSPAENARRLPDEG
jgi:hypothetical protein